jgi:hypothetical protein
MPEPLGAQAKVGGASTLAEAGTIPLCRRGYRESS